MLDVSAALLREGVLTKDALTRAEAAARDGDVCAAALSLGLASEARLLHAVCKLRGVPGIDLSRSAVPARSLDGLSLPWCRERRLLPIAVGKGELVLAMADPDDVQAADEVRYVTGKKVLCYLALASTALDRLAALGTARDTGLPAVRGDHAPELPDPAAAWVEVVHPSDRTPEDAAAGRVELVPLTDSSFASPFERGTGAAAVPARRAAGAVAAPSARPAPPVAAAAPRPAAASAGLPPAAPARPEEQVGLGKLVLVADDDPDVRKLMSRIAQSLGCQVIEAGDGKAALELTRAERPDVVLLDAMMPQLHGFEVCRAIKGDPALRATRVVLCSAVYRGTVGADAKVAFGADDYVEKPFRLEVMLRALKVALVGTARAESAEERAAREESARLWRAGAAACAQGRLDEGVALCRLATEKDPLSAEAHFYLGHALARRESWFEAAAAYERAAELRPDVDAAHQHLAQIYERLGFQKSARQEWQRAIESCRDDKKKKAMQARLIQLIGMA
ncbi:response regulator [Anaeromyxobacter paludicola]|uniref:Response regulatory domain-containing protein n=1 Tax=Anaeromyxobacter paludicola TaxID=2918171 RepID=A0ABN6NDB4_9BACT|nr:response regulator [Anaeromyxobacter paludicola]BDG10139.1 hypothetical protein AMPC_32520 [Anaeromyxobacter paludicola]